MGNVSINGYGDYAGSNYGRNALVVTIGKVMTVWFSYSTPIAFSSDEGFFIRENSWSATTGKHLNWIDDDHSKRISGSEFEEKLKDTLSRLKLELPSVDV